MQRKQDSNPRTLGSWADTLTTQPRNLVAARRKLKELKREPVGLVGQYCAIFP